MSAAVVIDRLEPAQHAAAKVAGFTYLFTLVTANFAEFYARGRLATILFRSSSSVRAQLGSAIS